VYTSRLIGSQQDLVLHGGGNTSVKVREQSIVGEEQEILYVKGSGADLATISTTGFVGLDLSPLRALRRLERLSDEDLENQLRIHKIRAAAPDPSVEALLHAFLPRRYVDHTHADDILVLTHQREGRDLIGEVLGPKVAVLSYTMSGLSLAKEVAAAHEKEPDIEAIVILNHGIFTFGDSAKASYGRMIACVRRAEAFIRKRTGSSPGPGPEKGAGDEEKHAAARVLQVLRGACGLQTSSGAPGRLIAELRQTPEMVAASLSADAPELCGAGVLTPDHAIRVKDKMMYLEAIPADDDELKALVNRRVQAYISDYHQAFDSHAQSKGMDPQSLDPYPRLCLVAGLGLIALGLTRRGAHIAADIGEHTVRAILRARALGDYVPLSATHVFDMEYWPLQRKKLGYETPLPLKGQTALITGGGGAIGRGVADRLLAAGAVVVIADIDEERLDNVHAVLKERYGEERIETAVFDVTEYAEVERAFDEISCKLGGIDILVPNAGIAYVARIEDLPPEKLAQVIAVNLGGTYTVIKASVPVFRRQGTGGNIVLISSKNVFDPGAAFGAYSAAKAGAHQLSRIAALELAELRVRVNMINPDAVFGDDTISSKLWDLVGPERMKSRGLDQEGLKEYYRQRNLLKARVLAEHVGNAVVFFASEQTPTTGASLPVDGGIAAAFPR
jgi:rhamnose utilization protein RhaD (predicted bifunctional aldolase and dehydrogenase)/NAD(P)-dependent dehydrogenase (short-subunit alcohol dehydrogenase family)